MSTEPSTEPSTVTQAGPTATTTDTRTGTPSMPDHRAPGLSAAIRAEWTKLRSSRAPRRNLVLGVVLAIVVTALVSLLIGLTFDEWTPEDQAEFDPLVYPLLGTMLTAVFFIAAGVGSVTSEYSSGMIGTTFAATPRRHRVLAAKAIIVAIVTAVLGAVTLVAVYAVANLVYGATGLPSIGLADADLWTTVLRSTPVLPVFPVLAVFLAAVLRSTAGSVTLMLVVLFVPSMVPGLFPQWWRRNIVSLLPGPAADSVSIGHLTTAPEYLHPAPAVGVLVAWVAIGGLLAAAVVARRDA